MTLATLPSRDVLLAQLAGGMASPLSTMAGLLAAPLRNLGYGLVQLRDQRASRPPERRHGGDAPTLTLHPTTAHQGRNDIMATKLSQSDILEAINGMPSLELSEFVKTIEETFGVSAAAPVAVAAAAGGRRREAEAAEEKTEFNVVLDRGRATTRSPSSRSSASSPASVSRRPRTSSRVLPSRLRGRRQGGGREDQGGARGAGSQGRHQVVAGPRRGAPAPPRRPARSRRLRRPGIAEPSDSPALARRPLAVDRRPTPTIPSQSRPLYPHRPVPKIGPCPVPACLDASSLRPGVSRVRD